MSRPPEVPENIPVVLVTPEMAQEYLATRDPDYERQLRQGRVEGMARDMKDGKFKFIGDPIRFAIVGHNLEDGQHRLSAVVESGVPQYFPVVNIPADARHVIDTGAKRTIADMLRKMGIGHGVRGRIMSAIAYKGMAWELGFVGSRGVFRPTADEMITYIRRNEAELIAATEIGNMVTGHQLPVSASSIGTMWYLTRRISAGDADSFWVTQVIKGNLLIEGDPASALRHRFLKDNRAGRRTPPIDVMLYGAIAWNHYRLGTRVSRLQGPKGGFTNRALTLR